MINPAFTGIDNQYRMFGFFRSQWGQMPGRPITGGATVEGSFWKDRIGAGLFVMNDRIGIFDQTNVSFSYAQKIKFAQQHQISIGIQGSAFINRINFSNARATDFNDPSVADQQPTKAVFDLNIGISYKWKGLLVGFSIPQVIQPNAHFATTNAETNYRYIRHYNAFAQYRITTLKEKFNITPTLFMRKGERSGFQFDATVMLDYKNIVFAGAGYRNSFGVVTMVGANIADMFTVAYAYDFTTQKTLRGQVGATHEVTAGFHLPSNYKTRKREEIAAKVKEEQLMNELQWKSDSLSARLKALKVKNDSLNRALKNVNLNKPGTGNNQKQIDSLQRVINSLFKNQRSTTDTAKGKGTSYTLDKIYFESKKSTLLKSSYPQLDSFVAFMHQFEKVEILIKGYADNTGSETLNQTLSENRAEAVAAYLISKGIAPARIKYQGFGSQYPIANNATEEGRQQNRRVEFTIEKE
jgi:type IX secretion system PorP/SprF family membrane protein